MLLLGLGRLGATPSATEYQVKAAFLFNFAKYVTWPAHAFPDATAPIRIGILGEDPFQNDLAEVVAGQKWEGRAFEIAHGSRAEDLASCQVIFISDSEQSRMTQHLAALRKARSPALVVGNDASLLSSGGMIRFVMERNKVRFEINLGNANTAGLNLSSKLLSLARQVDRPS